VRTNSHAELLIKGGGGGRVTGFDTGIQVTSGLDNRVNGVRVQGSAGIGVLISSSNGATLRNSRIIGSKSYGVQVNASDDVEVSDNEVVGPKNSGFSVTGVSVSNSLSSGNAIKRNLLRGGPTGDWGILVHGSAQETGVRKNVAKGWSQSGIEAYDSAADTTLALNKTVNNGADGIQIDGADGTRVLENLTRKTGDAGIELGQGSVGVGGNTAIDNDGWGILVGGIGPVTDLGGNRAAGNDAGQCSGVACTPP
jgi:Right handed beta helix region